MSLALRIADAWRKNSPELLGFVNGSLPAFVRARRATGNVPGIAIFSYHVVEAEALDADLRFLVRNGYHALSLDEVFERVSRADPLEGREVALTFDDGPRNFHDVALPLLQRHGLRATAFIAPGLHADDYGELQASSLRPMTWDEVRAAQASGCVDIQSHTLVSRYVPRWPAPAPLAGVDARIEARLRGAPLDMETDFRAARELIERQCPGARVRHLCYPMYHATPDAFRAARAAGYIAGYGGLLPGHPLATSGSSTDLLPRMSWEFLQRLPGAGRSKLTDLLRNRIADARRARSRRAATGAQA